MTADTAAIILIVLGAIAQTTFVIFYSFTSPWWQTLVGRALWTKAMGLALLMDISIAYYFLGDNYAARDFVRLSVYTFIVVGSWLQLIAFAAQKRRDNAAD